ncbi:MAG: isoprenylcysteine carboxylmethyltransferase family protein [Firmicutes bacterium]|nr:isoprenylcysteine carboxylmethyltransferase family protein [Bacillota bacterium]
MIWPQYGLWSLVVLNFALFVGFAVSFFKPRTRTAWRTLRAFSAFLLALFTEMYGFPLTLYLLWSWIGNRLPGLDPLSHDSGHLWQVLLGWQGDPHFNVLHIVSNLLIIGGFALIASGWRSLYRAVKEGRLATSGPYRWVRHPQYAGFLLVMVGFLAQWPTILTLLMFPVLVVMYVRLARREERALREQFGEAYQQYAAGTPAFIPTLASVARAWRLQGQQGG